MEPKTEGDALSDDLTIGAAGRTSPRATTYDTAMVLCVDLMTMVRRPVLCTDEKWGAAAASVIVEGGGFGFSFEF